MLQDHTLRYHAATLALIDEELAFSAAAQKTLDQLERLHGITLPASVREWYSLDNAVAILAKYSNRDAPVQLTDLGGMQSYHDLQVRISGEFDIVATGYLPVLVENQAVCTWALDLTTEAEDPPVVLADYNVTPTTMWIPCTDTFSRFVYTRVWDAMGTFFTRFLQTSIATMPVTSNMLDCLEQQLTRGTTNMFMPEVQAHRFGRSSQGMLLLESVEGNTQPRTSLFAPQWLPHFDCHIWADSEEEMELLLQIVSECPILRDVQFEDPRMDPSIWKHDTSKYTRVNTPE